MLRTRCVASENPSNSWPADIPGDLNAAEIDLLEQREIAHADIDGDSDRRVLRAGAEYLGESALLGLRGVRFLRTGWESRSRGQDLVPIKANRSPGAFTTYTVLLEQALPLDELRRYFSLVRAGEDEPRAAQSVNHPVNRPKAA